MKCSSAIWITYNFIDFSLFQSTYFCFSLDILVNTAPSLHISKSETLFNILLFFFYLNLFMNQPTYQSHPTLNHNYHSAQETVWGCSRGFKMHPRVCNISPAEYFSPLIQIGWDARRMEMGFDRHTCHSPAPIDPLYRGIRLLRAAGSGCPVE